MADIDRTRATRAAIQLHTHPSTTPEMGERELCVVIRPCGLNFSEYHGSRAQLEAEGVVPKGTKWPRAHEGHEGLRWASGEFRYWLHRIRPKDLKGPMKLWTGGDWWCLRWELLNGPDAATRSILEKKAELDAELYRHSAAGQRAWRARWDLYSKAHEDEAFQAFKALVPGLIQPKRGRKHGRPQGAAQGEHH